MATASATDTLTDLVLEVFRLNGRMIASGDSLVAKIGLTSARWQVLGAIDDDDCLTPLGWWGLPEAMRRVWAPSGGASA